jgi:glucose-6-phosphate isomerase
VTHDLFLRHPREPWALDATRMGLAPDELDRLGWSRAFADLAAVESGAVANPDEGRQVGHYWLRAPERAPTMGQARAIGETAEGVRSLAEQVLDGIITAEDGLRFRHVLHVGIGGSALGPQMLVNSCRDRVRGLPIHFLDNTDPDGIAFALAELGDGLRHTLVVVVSKSGSTPETRNALLLVEEALRGRGLEVASRMVAITGEGSVLHRRALGEGWLATFPLWDWVGGRTSVTAAAGLLPAALAGVDVQSVLLGARDMDEWTRVTDWRGNPAALLAGCWYLVGDGVGDRAMVALPYADRLATLSRYLQQLVMESLGKRLDLEGREVHQGLTVYGNKGSTDQHAYVQQLRDGRNDFFVQFVQVLDDGMGSDLEVESGSTAGDFLQGFLLGTRRALSAGDRPSLTLTLPTIDARQVGGVVALFERAVGLYASLVGINAYHQPGVEAGKKAASAVLDLGRALRSRLSRTPQPLDVVAEGLEVSQEEAWYLAERLVATGRASRTEDDRYFVGL